LHVSIRKSCRDGSEGEGEPREGVFGNAHVELLAVVPAD
jgi:hypothetical protein